MKKCFICGKEFIPRNSKQLCCSKECSNIYTKTNYKRNREKLLNRVKEYQKRNSDKVKEYSLEYNEKQKTVHKKICPICNKEFETTHSKKITCSDECRKIYVRQQTQEYLNKRYNNDLAFKIKVLCRINLRRCYDLIQQKKDTNTFSFLGYTPQELKTHLEKQFYGDMTWENYGKYWEIHHIKPLNEFNFGDKNNIDYKQLKIANSLENLKPLTKADHKLIHQQ